MRSGRLLRPFDVSLVVPWMIVSLVAVLQKNAAEFLSANCLRQKGLITQKGYLGDRLEDLNEGAFTPVRYNLASPLSKGIVLGWIL